MLIGVHGKAWSVVERKRVQYMHEIKFDRCPTHVVNSIYNRPQAQKVRDQRRRKLAYYNSGGNADQGASSDTAATPKTVSLPSPPPSLPSPPSLLPLVMK